MSHPISRRAASAGEGGQLFTQLAASLRGCFQVRSEPKSTHAEIRNREERQRFALEAAEVGLWEWRLDTDSIVWSELCHGLYGADSSLSTPSRAQWLDLLHPDDRSRVDLALTKALDHDSPEFRMEFRITHPDKGERWILARGKITTGVDGQVTGIAGVNIDVTPWHYADAAMQGIERQLAAAKIEAERANQAKGQFLASASHDLRQPVQSLMFFHSALAIKLKGQPASLLLDNMQGALDALLFLLDGLLEISKLHAGLVEARPAAFPIGDLLSRLAAEYRPQAKQSGLKFRVVPSKRWVMSDSVLLERMLRHLLDNAFKFTTSGGVLIGCRYHEDKVRIEIVDTGSGIPPQRHEDVFQEFVQLENPERDRRKGLGLGLAVVRDLAALLGHEISLRSQPGRGTMLSVSVPVTKPKAAAGRRRRTVRRMAPSRRLALVVDDELPILAGLRGMLEGMGWDVLVADSGEQALHQVSAARAPDVIVADYGLRGGETGIAVIRDIDGKCGVHVPALVVTGETNAERVRECRRNGLRLLHKPVTPQVLQQALADMVSDVA